MENNINIGPLLCKDCLTTDEIYNKYADDLSNKYTYNYNNGKNIENMIAQKLTEKINIYNINKSLVIQHYRFGRFSNYLFCLAHLVIVYNQFLDYFKNTEVEMLTNWHKTYFTDNQSQQKNIYKFNSDNEYTIFKNINCRHIANNDIFCNSCTELCLIKDGILDLQSKKLIINNIEFGLLYLYKLKNKNNEPENCVIHIIINLPIDTNPFNFEYINFENGYDKELFKYKYYLNPSCKKIISIGGFMYGDKNENIIKNCSKHLLYKFKLYFNYYFLKNNYSILKKYIFYDIDKYQSLYKPKNNDEVYICAHFRGGDYGVGINLTYPILYYTYYLDCLKDIQLKNINKKLNLIFNFHPNDKKIVEFYSKKIKENINVNITYDCEILNEMEHIYKMSSYNYYIMTNSSYSFWSAFLSNISSKIYYPKYYGIKYLGTNIDNMKIKEQVLYSFSENLFPENDKFIQINYDKVLHPAYFMYIFELNKEKIEDIKNNKVTDENITNIYLENILSIQDNQYDDLSVKIHKYQIELYKKFAKTPKYNFNEIKEIYIDYNHSIFERY